MSCTEKTRYFRTVVLKLFLLADPFCFFKNRTGPNNFETKNIIKNQTQNTYSSTTFTAN